MSDIHNPIVVTVGKPLGNVERVAVEEGTSVGRILEVSGVDPEGFCIYLDGSLAEKDDVVEKDATILLTKKIQGA